MNNDPYRQQPNEPEGLRALLATLPRSDHDALISLTIDDHGTLLREQVVLDPATTIPAMIAHMTQAIRAFPDMFDRVYGYAVAPGGGRMSWAVGGAGDIFAVDHSHTPATVRDSENLDPAELPPPWLDALTELVCELPPFAVDRNK